MNRLARRRRRRPPETDLAIGLFGVLGSGNWGNDGSLDVVVDFVDARFPEATLDFMAMGPLKVTAAYGHPAVPLQWYEANVDRLSLLPDGLLKIAGRVLDLFRTLRWVRHHDVVIVPGAGVFETTVPMRPWSFPLSLLFLGLAGRLRGTRVAYVAVGADVTRHGATAKVIQNAARLAHYRSYRDEMSRASMRDLGIDVRADKVFPDLAFALPVPARRPLNRRCVGVGVMNYRGAIEDRERRAELNAAYIDAVTRLVLTLVDEGWGVRLFTGDEEDDDVLREVMTSVTSRRVNAHSQITAESVGSLAELMDVVAGVDLVVASRYHNLLCALKVGVPALSISYARKNDALLASMGLGDFCHPAAEIDLDRLVAQFRELDRRRDELVAGLAEANRQNRRDVARQLDDLEDFLRG